MPKSIYLDPQTIERFWKNVSRREPDECWPWLAAKSKAGYGVMRAYYVLYYAHRIASTIAHGDAVEQAMHICDVRYPHGDISYRACCNPSHLKPGSSLENMRHGYQSGRIRHPRRPYRITPEQVRLIRELRVKGLMFKQIAEITGVNKITAGHIARGTRCSDCF